MINQHSTLKFAEITALCGTLMACVSTQPRETEPVEPVSKTQVAPAQLQPDECVAYVQLKRNEDYLCELPDGSTRPLKAGERRTSDISKQEIESVFARNYQDTQFCFDTVDSKDLKATGKLYLEFEVEADGRIAKVDYNETRSTYKNTKLAQCLSDKAKKWRFPVLKNEQLLKVNWPFQLFNADQLAPSPEVPAVVPPEVKTDRSPR